MKKAKINVFCNGIQYVAGQIYTSKEVAHLDQNDFEDVKSFTETIENKKISNPEKKIEVKTKKVK